MPHVWITGGDDRLRRGEAESIDLPPLTAPIDAHRRHRGPYTAAGTLLRALAPQLLTDSPDLVAAHDVEILSAAVELRDVVPASRETLTSLAVPQERTRFYSRLRTLRIANGLADLVRDHLRRTGAPRSRLVVGGVEHADPTDVELLTVLLRRLDPTLLTLVVCFQPVPDTDGRENADGRVDAGPGHAALLAALRAHATRHTAAADPRTTAADPRTTAVAAGHGTDAELARAYVATECTSDDPALVAAYHRIDPDARARLHDARAAALTATGERSLLLGAVPYHAERGSDPAGAGAQALLHALNHCIEHGFYDATIDLGRRGRAVVDPADQQQLWWAFTTKMTTSLAALSRAEEAEALYDDARATTTNPKVHMQAAYATAMLYTRHHLPERRDHRRAMAWINEAVAIAGLLPDQAERAFETVFQRNGLALVELHLGNLDEALRLVGEGIALLDRELGPGVHRLHRSVLVHNRGRVLAALGRTEEALADLTSVVAADPNYAEYHFERGNLLHALGRDEPALAEYAEAIRLSPPFPEVHYNRADVLLGRGETEAALADLGRVLDLDPGWVDAYVNRAGALAAVGAVDRARRDVDAGLALDPGNPYLHCLLGELHADAGAVVEARAAYRRAIDAAPDLPAAWAGLAALAHAAGDAAAAVAHLDVALSAGEDPALLFNRAVARLDLGRFAEAAADLDSALRLAPDDPDVLRERARCAAALGADPAGSLVVGA